MDESHEVFFFSFGISISVATMIVSILKIFTQYYFYYLTGSLICISGVLLFFHYHQKLNAPWKCEKCMAMKNDDSSSPREIRMSEPAKTVDQSRKITAISLLGEMNSYFRRQKSCKDPDVMKIIEMQCDDTPAYDQLEDDVLSTSSIDASNE